MARTKKGRAVSGWLVVDKPAGITSTAVVNKVKWALGAQKAGHAGTLDPAATGVLAVALGEATKTVPHVTDALKCYRFMVRWGAATTTDDAEGAVVETSDARPADDDIRAALAAYRGEIQQDLAARPLWVESLDLLERPDADHALFEMVCGKGGYVRSVARDLGRDLGCLGHVLWLRRDWSGPFAAGDGISMEEIERLAHQPELDAHLKP
jgi:tRNA pseudouridine55 synthase